MNVLEKLIGQSLMAVKPGEGNVALKFSGATLSAYNPIMEGNLQQCVGVKVTSIEFDENQVLRLMFSNALQFAISLKESDYVGPEAFCVRFDDGTTVVE